MTASDDASAPGVPQSGRIGYEETDHFGQEEGVRVGGVAHLTEAPSPFGGERHPDPCSLVIFGVTGDLTHRKLIPALYDLGCHGVLPFGTTLVGYGFKGSANSQNRTVQEITLGFNQTIWKDAKYGAINFMGQYEYLMRRPWYVALNTPKATHDNTIYFNVRYTLPGGAPAAK